MHKRALLKHPRTGSTLEPVGFRRDGSAIWPILGASDDDASNDEVGSGGSDDESSEDAQSLTDAATSSADGEKDWKSEAEKWKKFSRQHEDAAKANADKARRFDEFEEANKTELQKANDLAAASRTEAEQAKAENAALKAAIKFKLSDEDLELLGTHGTPEDIESRAAKLAARLAAVERLAPAKGPRRLDLGQGGRGDGPSLDQQIADAQKAGNFQLVIALKQQKARATSST